MIISRAAAAELAAGLGKGHVRLGAPCIPGDTGMEGPRGAALAGTQQEPRMLMGQGCPNAGAQQGDLAPLYSSW